MRFLIFVEGDTERAAVPAFLSGWLNQRVSSCVGVRPVRFKGCPHFLSEIRKIVHNMLEGPSSSEVIAGIGLLDLYGFPAFPEHLKSVGDRYAWAVEDIEGKVDHPKFRMYFAVYELEAWLLSQPEILPVSVQRALPKTTQRPEDIDFDRPPSRLLQQLYSEKARCDYHKRVTGKALFAKLDPNVAYEKCPYLHRMLDDMLRFARKAGLCEPVVLR
jgi:hypothetical protein